jgi:DNA-directed RNA polymerase subunit RPC12/RpoP
MVKRTFSLLLTLCLLLASIPMAQATECPNGGVHEITADGTYTVAISEPTCTEAGVAVYTCTACGEAFARIETEPATGHDQRGLLSVMPATCTEPETEYISCSKCGSLQVHGTYGEPLGHNDQETNRTDATCTADGWVTYTCTREGCGASHTETLAATGHDYQETGRKNATCTARGSVTYTCTRCGDSYAETIHAKGHRMTTSDGYTYTCTRCGLIEVDEEEKVTAEATPMPDAYGTVNEGGDLTDLTLTSAIKQAGGGYSLRREEATLESITLAS